MGIFKKNKMATLISCPACGGTDVGLGYVDRVTCSVLHTCNSCSERWRDRLIDLASTELAQRVGA